MLSLAVAVEQHSRDAEIEQLDVAARRDLDVRRLQIAMNHAAIVCGVERFSDGLRDADGLAHRDRAAAQPLLERDAFDKLQHQRANAIDLDGVVDGGDAGMVQRR